MNARGIREQKGQATVEFAIVIPLLLLLVLGILEFGKAFNYWINLNHLSNEGARWAAVDKVPGNSTPDCLAFKHYLLGQMGTGELESYVAGGDPPANPLIPNITLKVAGTGPNNAPQIGDPVTVTVKAPGYKIASLGEAVNLGSVTLTGRSTMRLEQVPSWTTGTDITLDSDGNLVC
jgi:hypothetical protein